MRHTVQVVRNDLDELVLLLLTDALSSHASFDCDPVDFLSVLNLKVLDTMFRLPDSR